MPRGRSGATHKKGTEGEEGAEVIMGYIEARNLCGGRCDNYGVAVCVCVCDDRGKECTNALDRVLALVRRQSGRWRASVQSARVIVTAVCVCDR